MGKLNFFGVAALIVLLIGAVSLLVAKDGLNKSDTFVYKDEGIFYWIELTNRKGKVGGTFHQHKMIDEIGQVPFIEEKEYPLSGEATEKGYEFQVTTEVKTMKFDATFSGKNLSVQEQGESENKLFQLGGEEKLEEYEKELQEELQIAIDQSEEKFKSFIRTFFSELNSVYGYLYTAEDGAFQLFLKIDEALLQGEVSGSLLMMVNTGNESNPYEEVTYEVNGITDGHMLKFYTTVDRKETKLEGNFFEHASGFDLSFWTTDQKLTFYAVTKEEYEKSYEEFKTKVQNGKSDKQD